MPEHPRGGYAGQFR